MRFFWLLLLTYSTAGCATYYAQLQPRAATQPATPPPMLVTNQLQSPFARAALQASRISQRSGQTIAIWIDDPYGVAASCTMCTDGPNIFADSRFLQHFSYAEQVAIFAHEFAHGDLGHVTFNAEARQAVAQLLDRMHGGGDWSPGAALLGSLAATVTTATLTRTTEAEADLYAATRLPLAGVPSTTMADTLERILQMQGDGRTVFWEQDHPPNTERITYLRQRFDPTPSPVTPGPIFDNPTDQVCPIGGERLPWYATYCTVHQVTLQR